MIYLVSLSVVVWLLGMLPSKYGLRQNSYKNYLLIAGVLVVLITGLRDPLSGSPDTFRYTLHFDGLARYEDFKTYYDLRLSEEEFFFSESGFHFFAWLLTRFFSNSQMIVFASMAVCTFAVCRFIHKNVTDAPMGLLIYICLGLLTFNMNGMRQAMAMSVCLFSYEYAKERRVIPFVLTVLLAMLFHKTAICFFPVYFLPILKEGKGNTFFYFVAMIIFLFAMDWFIETFNAFTGEDYEIDNQASGGGLTVILIYGFAIIFALLMHESLKKREIRVSFFGVVAGFAAYLSRFFSNQILERISYYYFYFMILLIPQLIEELDDQEKKIAKVAFSAFAILLLWYRTRNGAFANMKLFFQR